MHPPSLAAFIKAHPGKWCMRMTQVKSLSLDHCSVWHCWCRQLQSANFEAWTSPVEADILAGSQVVSKRVDILLGSSLGTCKGAGSPHLTVISLAQESLISLLMRLSPGLC